MVKLTSLQDFIEDSVKDVINHALEIEKQENGFISGRYEYNARVYFRTFRGSEITEIFIRLYEKDKFCDKLYETLQARGFHVGYNPN